MGKKNEVGVIVSPAERRMNKLKLLVCIVLFVVIASFLDDLELLSKPLLEFVMECRFIQLDYFLKLMGFFGFEFFFLIIPITCFAISLHNLERKLSFGFDLILLLTYTWLVGSLIKAIFARDRPYQLFDDIHTPAQMEVLEYSFPSGHSCGSMICWTFLYDRLKQNKSKNYQVLLYIATWGIVGLASGSRFYFCVHFPHDIIGEWLLAFILYRFYSDWHFLSSMATLSGLLVTMIITCFLSTPELLLHMPGLITCTASLSAIITCAFFYKHLPEFSPLGTAMLPASRWWKTLLRVVIVSLFFSAVGFSKAQLTQSIVSLFLTGYFMSLWILWLAPALLAYLSLY